MRSAIVKIFCSGLENPAFQTSCLICRPAVIFRIIIRPSATSESSCAEWSRDPSGSMCSAIKALRSSSSVSACRAGSRKARPGAEHIDAVPSPVCPVYLLPRKPRRSAGPAPVTDTPPTSCGSWRRFMGDGIPHIFKSKAACFTPNTSGPGSGSGWPRLRRVFRCIPGPRGRRWYGRPS